MHASTRGAWALRRLRVPARLQRRCLPCLAPPCSALLRPSIPPCLPARPMRTQRPLERRCARARNALTKARTRVRARSVPLIHWGTDQGIRTCAHARWLCARPSARASPQRCPPPPPTHTQTRTHASTHTATQQPRCFWRFSASAVRAAPGRCRRPSASARRQRYAHPTLGHRRPPAQRGQIDALDRPHRRRKAAQRRRDAMRSRSRGRVPLPHLRLRARCARQRRPRA